MTGAQQKEANEFNNRICKYVYMLWIVTQKYWDVFDK